MVRGKFASLCRRDEQTNKTNEAELGKKATQLSYFKTESQLNYHQNVVT